MFLSNLLLCPLAEQAFACSASQPQSLTATSPSRGTRPALRFGRHLRCFDFFQKSRWHSGAAADAAHFSLCSSGRLRYSISFGNLIAASTRRVVATGESCFCQYFGRMASPKSHRDCDSTSREIHLERVSPLQVPVRHYRVPGGGKLSSPGTATPVLHHCRACARAR